jgi:hypothetical protein
MLATRLIQTTNVAVACRWSGFGHRSGNSAMGRERPAVHAKDRKAA